MSKRWSINICWIKLLGPSLEPEALFWWHLYILIISLYTKRILPISWTRNCLNAFPPMALLFILLQPLKTWVIFCHCHLWHSFYSLHSKPPTLWPSFPSPGNLPNPGIKSIISCIVGDSLLLSHQGSPLLNTFKIKNYLPTLIQNCLCQHHQWLSLIESTGNLNLHLIWIINYLCLILPSLGFPVTIQFSVFLPSLLSLSQSFFDVIFFSWSFSQCFLGLRY